MKVNNSLKLIIIFLGLFLIPLPLAAQEIPYIDNYIVKLDVSVDNNIKVAEEMIFSFPKISKYSVNRILYNWDTYLTHDGKKIERRSMIENITSNGNLRITSKMHEKTISVGDDNVMFEGHESFFLNYDYLMGEDPFDNYDEFIYHFFDRKFTEEIKNANIEINMPKPITGKKVTFWCGIYQQTDCTDRVEINIENNKLTGILKVPIDGSLSINIELEEGYFEGGNKNYGYITIAIVIISVLVLLFSIIQFVDGKLSKYRTKKYRKICTAPDNLTAAEVGYAKKEKDLLKLMTASLAELAAKQYIKITKKNDQLVIIKTRNYRGDKEVDKILVSNLPMLDYEYPIKKNRIFFVSMQKELKKYFSEIFYYRMYRNKFNIVVLALARGYILAALLLIAIVYIKDLDPKLTYLLYIGILSAYGSTLISFFDHKKNIFGYEIQRKTRGFKKTLENISPEEVTKNIADDKFYQYKIAPHAYILGVLKSFNKNFTPPEVVPYNEDTKIFINPEDFNELYNTLKNTLE